VHHSLGRFGAETPTPAWTTRVEPALKETNRHSPVSARRDRANPIGVLKAKYPVVCRLVTEPSFRLAARCYIVADPSDIPIAHSYGDDFPRFLRSRSSLACVEYVAGVAELEIFVDAHERYAYRFAGQQVATTSRGLPCGDYGIIVDGTLVAAVERKSLPDLISSLTTGRLRYALGELAALPRAALVVEDRYSQIYKQDRVRPALVADGLAECQIRWPNVPIVFCENRSLAEEWTYRYLARRPRLGLYRAGRHRTYR